MKNIIPAVVSALALCAMSTSASAVTFFYSFAANNGMDGANGTLTATANGDGTYTATSGTIVEFGPLLTGIGSLISNPSAPAAQTSPGGFFIYDDQLLPAQNPLITNPGLLFNIGGLEVNIFSNGPGPGTYDLCVQPNNCVLGDFALSLVSVPEPATWALMLVGFAGVGFGLRSRAKALAA